MQIENLETRELLAVDLAAMASHIVRDNVDTVYSETGANWQALTDSASYGGTARYHAGGDGSDGAAATWSFTSLDANKSYQVFATWSADSNRASNAPFSVADGTTSLATVRLNQQFAPNDATGEGTIWQSLGTYSTSSGTLNISLGDEANGYVVADAICIAEVSAVTTARSELDNSNAAYAETGSNWLGYSETAANQGGYRYHATGSGANAATWTFQSLDPAKQYQVYATWTAGSNRASNAPYTLLDGTTSLATVRLNQQFAPADITVDGQGWQSLGVCSTSSGTLTIRLTDDANGYVIADGIRLFEITPTTPTMTSVYDLNAANNWSVAPSQSYLVANDATVNKVTADDFVLAQTTNIQKLTVHGNLNLGINGLDPTNVVVKFMADNGATGADAQFPSTVLKSITVAWSDCSYENGLLTVDFSGNEADWFEAAAGTRYWLSVQPTVYDGGGSFTWDWSNDAAHPSAYNVQGTGGVVLNSSGVWEHNARWWRPGDWQFDPMWAVQSYSGDMPATVSISGQTASDPQHLDLNFELFGTTAAAAAAPSLIDNADTGYIETGGDWNWLGYSESGAYEGSFRYHTAGNGSNAATWNFDGLVPNKNYQVYATWSAGSNRASNSPFTILDDTTVLTTTRLNQQFAPSDATLENQNWSSLGVFTASSGTLTVRLTDDANGMVIADAIRIIEVVDVTTAPSVIDDGDSAYAETGNDWNWLGYSEPAALNGDFRYHGAGTGSNTASWTAAALPPGVYQVYATWSAGSNRATNAPFTVCDGSTPLATVRLNQQSAPSDTTIDNQGWASLGVYTIENGTLRVLLSDDANGYVVADGIRLVPINQAPSFAIGIGQTVTVGAGEQTVSGFVSSINPGPASESSQTVSFLVSVDHSELFSVQPTIDANGNLTYTPSVEATGTAVVTVVAQDSGGTLYGGDDTSGAQTFTVTVSAVPGSTSLYGVNATGDWTSNGADSYRVNNDLNVNKQAADDFLLSQTSDVKKVAVRGELNLGFNGLAPVNVVVTFLADNGETDTDLGAPSTVLKSITVPWSDCTYDVATKLLMVDFSGTRVDWFRTEANTRYWISVQPTVYDSAGSFRVYRNNDAAHPSTYSLQGSSAVVLNSSGNWVREGRWWNPGDVMTDPGWIVQSYSGTLPTSVQSSFGTTCPDGQRLDLGFELFGDATPATITVSGEAIAYFNDVYTLTLGSPTGPMADSVASYQIDWGDGTTPTQIAASELPSSGEVNYTYTIDEAWCTIVVTLLDASSEIVDQERMTIFVDPPPTWVYPLNPGNWSDGATKSYRNNNDPNVNLRAADDFLLSATTDIKKITAGGELNIGFLNFSNPSNVVVTFMADSENGNSNLDGHAPSAILKQVTVPWQYCSYSNGVLTVDFSDELFQNDWFHAVGGVRYWMSIQPTMTDPTGWFRWHWNNTADPSGTSTYVPNGAAAVSYYANLGEWVHQARWWHPNDAMLGNTWFIQGYEGALPSNIQYTMTTTVCTNGQRLDLSFKVWGNAAEAPNANGVLYWDPQGSSTAWDSGTNWRNAASQHIAWVDGSVAVFDSTGNAVTITGTVGPSSVLFCTSGYTLTGGTLLLPTGSGVLEEAVIEVGQNATATINCTIAGGTLNKTGTGTLIIGATTNSYGGGTVLANGSLSTSKDNLGTATSSVEFVGGTLRVTGSTLHDLGNHSINTTTFDGGFDISNAYNTFTVDQSISGLGGLAKTGPGMLMLTGTEIYTGWTIVDDGTLYLEHGLTGRVAAPGGVIVGPGAPSFWSVNLNALEKLQGSWNFDPNSQLSASPAAIQASDVEMAVMYAIAGTVRIEDHPDKVLTFTPSPVCLASYTDAALANVNGMSIWITNDGTIQINDGGGVSGKSQADSQQSTENEPFDAPDTDIGAGVGGGKASGPGDLATTNGSTQPITSAVTGTTITPNGELITDPLENVSSPDANGQHYSIAQLGWLRVFGSGNDTVVEVVSQTGRTQKWTGTNLVPENPGRQGTLTWNSSDHTYTETDLDGTRFVFAWKDAVGFQPGRLIQRIPASGSGTITYSYDLNNSQWSTCTETGDGWTQRATYTIDPDTGDVLRQDVANLEGPVAAPTDTRIVGKVVYTYYSADGDNGNVGDLQLIQSYNYDGNSTSYELVKTTYYRYYTGAYDASLNRGLNDYVKYIVTGPSADRLIAANSLSPTSTNLAGELDVLLNRSIAVYADQHFKYAANGTVSQMHQAGTGDSIDGGIGFNHFNYTSSKLPHGMNTWDCRRVQTIGNLANPTKTVTTFSNYEGDLILEDVTDSSGVHWITYHQYDEYGHVTRTYHPSAVAGWNINSATDALEVTLNSTTGLVDVYQYYTSTTAPEYPMSGHPTSGGGVQGYLWRSGVQHGSAGTPVWQSQVDYVKKTVNGITDYYEFRTARYASDPGASPNFDPAITPGAETTTYTYTFYSSGITGPTLKSLTTTLPTVATSQHGSGTATSGTVIYDTFGRVVWSKDAAGVISYVKYDPATGAVIKQIQDVDLTQTGQFTSVELALVSAWSTPSEGGKNLITTYGVDAQGRTVKMTDPLGYVTWTVYNDAQHETRVYPGWHQDANGYWRTTGPIQVHREDWARAYTETLTYSWTDTTGFDSDYRNSANGPNGEEALTDSYVVLQSLSRKLLNSSGQAVASLQYTDLDGVTYSQTVKTFGTAGANYLETDYSYDLLGRPCSTREPSGTITHTFYNAMSNVMAVWQGTDDLASMDIDADGLVNANDYRAWVTSQTAAVQTVTESGSQIAGMNMYLITANTYNKDGKAIESKSCYNASSEIFGDFYSTKHQYDWRGRQLASLGPDAVAHVTAYDNLGRATDTYTYANATYNTSSGAIEYSSGNLRAEAKSLYDSLGRVFESRAVEVNPSNGAVGDYLATDYWYDASGRIIKTRTGSNGVFQKYGYDTVGNLAYTYTSYDAAESDSNYTAALSVDGDKVVEQVHTWYDADHRAVATANYQRLPSDTASTGRLTATNSYVMASAKSYDALGRTVENVNYGRVDVLANVATDFFYANGSLMDDNGNLIPDAPEGELPPIGTLNYIVTKTVYSDSTPGGPIVDRIDNGGRTTRTHYDLAGRTIRAIQNYDNGTVEVSDTDKDVTTEYRYDNFGRLVTLIAYNAKGTSLDSQATKYLYTSPFHTAWQTAVIYPDSTDTVSGPDANGDWSISSGSDHTSITYDRLGRKNTTTDQRGVVHTYGYDSAGRLATDTITNFGSSGIVDQTVAKIATAYDDIGRVEQTTSYNSTNNVLNQVKNRYDSWGNLTQQWQALTGEVNTETTPSVQFTYADGLTYNSTNQPAPYVRLAIASFPNNYQYLQYDYGAMGSSDDILSRPHAVRDNVESLYVAYQYLGTNTIVGEYRDLGAGSFDGQNYTHLQLGLDHTADNFSSLDRFGRVVDQVWALYDATSGTPVKLVGSERDRYTYTYDEVGNRTSRLNALAVAMSELYEYDDLDRLTAMARGTVVNGEIPTPTHTQGWDLDALGNFGEFTDDAVTQTRSVNVANEIQNISGSAGWITPSYDAAGNMISGPQPGSEATRNHYTYDAWNRLVKVRADSSGTPGATLAEYEYDGTDRRIVEIVGTTAEFSYYQNQQVAEVRRGTSTSNPASLDPTYQYLWSQRGDNAPILRDSFDGNGDLVLNDRIFYTDDTDHNVTGLVARGGAVIERCVYNAYGQTTYLEPDWDVAAVQESSVDNNCLFAGMNFDIESGLYYDHARYYSMSTGGFLSRAPLGYHNGWNLYAYSNTSPDSERHGDPSDADLLSTLTSN